MEVLFKKLGSPIFDVRAAALKSLRFKLENKLVEAYVLCESDVLLSSLIKWFNTDDKLDSMVDLLARLLEADSDCYDRLARLGALPIFERCLSRFVYTRNRIPFLKLETHVLIRHAGMRDEWIPVLEKVTRSLAEIAKVAFPREIAVGEKYKEAFKTQHENYDIEPQNSEPQHFQLAEKIDPVVEVPQKVIRLLPKVTSDSSSRERMEYILKNVRFDHCFTFPEVALNQDDSRFIFDLSLKLRTRHIPLIHKACAAFQHIITSDFPPETVLQSPKLFNALIFTATNPYPLAESETKLSKKYPLLISGIPSTSVRIVAANKATECIARLFTVLEESARQYKDLTNVNLGSNTTNTLSKDYRYPPFPGKQNGSRQFRRVSTENNLPLSYAAHLVFTNAVLIMRDRNRAVCLSPMLLRVSDSLFCGTSSSEGRKSDVLRSELYIALLAEILQYHGAESIIRDRALLTLVEITVRIAEWHLEHCKNFGNLSRLGDLLAELLAKGSAILKKCSDLDTRILKVLRPLSPVNFRKYLSGRAVIHSLSLSKRISSSTFGDGLIPTRALEDSLASLDYEHKHLSKVIKSACLHIIGGVASDAEVGKSVLMNMIESNLVSVRKKLFEELSLFLSEVSQSGDSAEALDFFFSEAFLYRIIMFCLDDSLIDSASWGFLETLSICFPPLFQQAVRPLFPVFAAQVGCKPVMSGLKSMVSTVMHPKDLVLIHVQGLFVSNSAYRSAAARALRPLILKLSKEYISSSRAYMLFSTEVKNTADPIRRFIEHKGNLTLHGGDYGSNDTFSGSTSNFREQDVSDLVRIFTSDTNTMHLRREAAVQLYILANRHARFASVLRLESVVDTIWKCLTNISDCDLDILVFSDVKDSISQHQESSSGPKDMIFPCLQLLRLAASYEETGSFRDSILSEIDILNLVLPWIFAHHAGTAKIALELAAWVVFGLPVFDEAFVLEHGLPSGSKHKWERGQQRGNQSNIPDSKSLVSIPASILGCFEFPFEVSVLPSKISRECVHRNPRCGLADWMVKAEEEQDKSDGEQNDPYLKYLLEGLQNGENFESCQTALLSIRSYFDANPNASTAFWRCAWLTASQRFLWVLPLSVSDNHLFSTMLHVLSKALSLTEVEISPESCTGLLSIARRLLPLIDPPSRYGRTEAVKSDSSSPKPPARLAVIKFLSSLFRYAASPSGRECHVESSEPGLISSAPVEESKTAQDKKEASACSFLSALSKLDMLRFLVDCTNQDVGVDIDATKPWPLSLQLASLESIVVLTSSNAYVEAIKAAQSDPSPLLSILSLPAIPNAFLRKNSRRLSAQALWQILSLYEREELEEKSILSTLVSIRMEDGQTVLDIPQWLVELSRDREDSVRILAFRIAGSILRISGTEGDSKVTCWGTSAHMLVSTALDCVKMPKRNPSAVRSVATLLLSAVVQETRKFKKEVRVGGEREDMDGERLVDFTSELVEVLLLVVATPPTIPFSGPAMSIVAEMLKKHPSKTKAVVLRADIYLRLVETLKLASRGHSTVDKECSTPWFLPKLIRQGGIRRANGKMSFGEFVLELESGCSKGAIGNASQLVTGTCVLETLNRLIQIEPSCVRYMLASEGLMRNMNLFLTSHSAHLKTPPTDSTKMYSVLLPAVQSAFGSLFMLHTALLRANPTDYGTRVQGHIQDILLAAKDLLSWRDLRRPVLCFLVRFGTCLEVSPKGVEGTRYDEKAKVEHLPKVQKGDERMKAEVAICEGLVALFRQLYGQASKEQISPFLDPKHPRDPLSDLTELETSKDLALCAAALSRILASSESAKDWLCQADESEHLSWLLAQLERLHSLACLHRLERGEYNREMEKMLRARMSHILDILKGATYNEDRPTSKLKVWLVEHKLPGIFAAIWSYCSSASREQRLDSSDKHTISSNSRRRTPNSSTPTPRSSTPNSRRTARSSRTERRVWWGLDGRRHVEIIHKESANTESEVIADDSAHAAEVESANAGTPKRSKKKKLSEMLTPKHGRKNIDKAKRKQSQQNAAMQEEESKGLGARQDGKHSSVASSFEQNLKSAHASGQFKRKRHTHSRSLMKKILHIVANLSRGDSTSKIAFCQREGKGKPSVIDLIVSLAKSESSKDSDSLKTLALKCLQNLAICPPAAKLLIRSKFVKFAWSRVCAAVAPTAALESRSSVAEKQLHFLKVLSSICLDPIGCKGVAEFLIPKQLGAFASLLEAKAMNLVSIRKEAYDLLRRLAFHPLTKTALISEKRILELILNPISQYEWLDSTIEDKHCVEIFAQSNAAMVEYASQALWSCIYDNTKGRAQLAKSGINFESASRSIKMRISEFRNPAPSSQELRILKTLERASHNFSKLTVLCRGIHTRQR